jgi:drug/metabolite transporter (DMT)-like permease
VLRKSFDPADSQDFRHAQSNSVSIFLFFVSILSFSMSPLLAKLSAAPPELISFWRLVVAGSLIFLVSLRNPDRFKNWKQLHGKTAFFATVSGLVFYIHLWSFQYAAQAAPIGNMMILFSTNPIYTALISTFFLHVHFEKRLIPAYLLCMVGIFILVNHNLHFDHENLRGNLAGLAAAILFSIYILCGHEARKKLSNFTYTSYIYAIASTCFGLTVYFRGVSFVQYPSITWFSIGGLILIPTLLGHVLFTYLLQHMNVNWLSTGKLSEPIFASIASFFLFGEQWTLASYTAFAFTAMGLLVLLQPWKHWRKDKSAVTPEP